MAGLGLSKPFTEPSITVDDVGSRSVGARAGHRQQLPASRQLRYVHLRHSSELVQQMTCSSASDAAPEAVIVTAPPHTGLCGSSAG